MFKRLSAFILKKITTDVINITKHNISFKIFRSKLKLFISDEENAELDRKCSLIMEVIDKVGLH